MQDTDTITSAAPRAVNLDDLIPAPSLATAYVNRTIGGFSDFDTFDAALASGHNVMLTGPTGTGKTFGSRAYAAARGLPWYRIPVNGAMDVSTVIGTYTPREVGDGLEWHYGVLAQMIIERRGVAVFDEINMGIERNLARFYSLWDSGREMAIPEHLGEVLRVPPGSEFLVVAAYNPGYRGTRELSQAMPNRFAFRMKFDYDREIEEQLVPSPSLLDVAEKLRGMSREIKTPVSTNMLIEFCEIAMAFDVHYANTNFAEIFPATEINSVKQVLDLHRDRIAQEIADAATALDEEGA